MLPAYPPTIRARGAIRFALHDFGGALADAEQVLRAAPGRRGGPRASPGTRPSRLGDLDGGRGPLRRPRRPGARTVAGRPAGPPRLRSVATTPAPWPSPAARRPPAATADDPAETGFYAFAVGEYARLAGDADRPCARSSAPWPPDRPTSARSSAWPGSTPPRAGPSQAIDGLRARRGDRAAAGDPGPARGPARPRRATWRARRSRSPRSGLIARLGDVQGQRLRPGHPAVRAGSRWRSRGGAGDGAGRPWPMRPDAAGHDLVAWALHRLGRDDEALAAIDAARALGRRRRPAALPRGRDPAGAGRCRCRPTLLQEALDLGPALDPSSGRRRRDSWTDRRARQRGLTAAPPRRDDARPCVHICSAHLCEALGERPRPARPGEPPLLRAG